MPKFSSNSWSSVRNSLTALRNIFKLNRFTCLPQKSSQYRKRSPRKYIVQCFGSVITIIRAAHIVSPIFFKSEKKSYKSAYEIEKEITDIVINAEEMVIKNDISGAKGVLQEALKIAEDTNVYGNITSVYDLLVTIALREGGITEAEDMLANFIEKLVQLGYPEDHNSVIKFKLKLARLYQSIGNLELAEYGFRDCISIQEKKLLKRENIDDNTILIYVNSLFWYGKLLTENGDYSKAKKYMTQTLSRMQQCSLIAPSQIMVVLYHNAEIATILKEYDAALDYLYKAIDLCNSKDRGNPDLPLYVLKVGEIFLFKGLYDNAEFWCTSAKKLSQNTQNEDAAKEAAECIKKLNEMKNSKKKQSGLAKKNRE